MLYLLAFPHDKISLRFLLGCKTSDFKHSQYEIIKNYVDEHNSTFKDVLDDLVIEKINIPKITGILNEYKVILNDISILKRRILEESEFVFEYFYKTEDENIEFEEITNLYQKIISENPFESSNEPEYFQNWIKAIITKLTESIATPDSPETIDHVRIMSLHASKGLSAKFVIMASMIDKLIPFTSDKNTNDLQTKIEEQRRLFYVAMTRCKSSESDYPGRLLISSFAWIHGIDALKIGLKANPTRQKQVQATRFLDDFGRLKPQTKLGSAILKSLGIPT